MILEKVKIRFIIVCFILISACFSALSQDRFEILEQKTDSLSKKLPALNSLVNISVTGVSIQEFLRGIAVSNKVNLDISPELDIKVINNFSNVKVVDVLMFLCKQYNLDLTFTGSIISVSKFPEIIEYIPKKLKIDYNTSDDLLSLELNNDSLLVVAKKITKISGKNIILAPGLDAKIVSVYINNMPFDNVLDKLAFANDLEITKTEDNFYLVKKKEVELKAGLTPGRTGKEKGRKDSKPSSVKGKLEISANNINDISISAENIDFSDIIKQVSDKLGVNYFLISEIEGTITLKISGISYDNLLMYLLNGTDYTFKKQGDIYLIGVREIKELNAYTVIQLQYRTVEKIIDFIPEDLKNNIEIIEFTELNSLLVSGTHSSIQDLENFIEQIDKTVPVILIEVIIIDIKKSKLISTGIDAGLGEAPVSTQGAVLPSVEFQLNASSINNIINSFDGFGWLNLKSVTPNFYMNLKALEEDGIIKIRSTPKLSTLNGHEATLSIGNTEYYLEEQNNIIGTLNPQLTTTKTYKAVDATLTITIKPIVSGDNQITLDIEVTQSDFTGRISKFAPPGAVKREFKSLIRIKDQEMILLGGLEEKRNSDSSSGLPFLSRIPVIKWIFSSRNKKDSKSKLNIFIKPTIIN
ncbi:MAG: hypothetical protein KAT68_02940 [Bacteroidales bacterium]|nr:hypothetical protein [Bacteroidales bacterium]